MLLATQPDSTTATKTSPSLRRKRVLIADDDCIFLKALSMKLTNNGYEVITTRDGAGTISLARTGKPDLILLDISFPPDVANGGRVTWDGFQIMSWLRGLKESGRTPFIIMTSGDPGQYEQAALAHGAAAFFQKPIDSKNLLLAIKQVLFGGI